MVRERLNLSGGTPVWLISVHTRVSVSAAFSPPASHPEYGTPSRPVPVSLSRPMYSKVSYLENLSSKEGSWMGGWNSAKFFSASFTLILFLANIGVQWLSVHLQSLAERKQHSLRKAQCQRDKGVHLWGTTA